MKLGLKRIISLTIILVMLFAFAVPFASANTASNTARGWVRNGITVHFYLANGQMARGWQPINGNWYYFNPTTGDMHRGWLQDGTVWYYLQVGIDRRLNVITNTNIDGVMATSANGPHFDENGRPQSFDASGRWQGSPITTRLGWSIDNGTAYYYENGIAKSGWFQDPVIQNPDRNTVHQGRWYYLNPRSGAMMTGWVQVENRWYYMNPQGTLPPLGARGVMHKGWLDVDGHTYFMHDTNSQAHGTDLRGELGSMATGWQTLTDRRGGGTSMYFFQANGSMARGTITIDGRLQEFSATGAWIGETQHIRNGWQRISTPINFAEGDEVTIKYIDAWYYYQNGVMAIGWHRIGSSWFYFREDNDHRLALYPVMPVGSMMTGWAPIGGEDYFFRDDGRMVTGWHWFHTGPGERDGEWRFFRSSGALVTGWYQEGSIWYYLDPDNYGRMVTGPVFTVWNKDHTRWEDHEFRANGSWIREIARGSIDGGTGGGGTSGGGSGSTTGGGWEFITDTGWVYYTTDGSRYTGWLYDNGWYYLNSNGVMQTGWIELNGSWYWLRPNGLMVTGTVTITNGERHEFRANGTWVRRVR